MSGRAWGRLRLFEVGPPTEIERLERLMKALLSDRPLSADERRETESFLYRLRNNPKAMKAILSAGRGRHRDSRAPDIALDYLAQKQLLGKATAAKKAVAQAWTGVLRKRVSEATVQDAFTDWKGGAEWRLSRLIDHKVGQISCEWSDGRPTEYWTREELLEAVSLDVRDMNRAEGRKKSKRIIPT